MVDPPDRRERELVARHPLPRALRVAPQDLRRHPAQLLQDVFYGLHRPDYELPHPGHRRLDRPYVPRGTRVAGVPRTQGHGGRCHVRRQGRGRGGCEGGPRCAPREREARSGQESSRATHACVPAPLVPLPPDRRDDAVPSLELRGVRRHVCGGGSPDVEVPTRRHLDRLRQLRPHRVRGGRRHLDRLVHAPARRLVRHALQQARQAQPGGP
mmetsp:Transcript_77103/g.221523  ORF Transcript_77103/g.221523 Transcript_77103/m.221523 type:complete len:212 (+) Transcript_77103:1803-2438(+)